MNNINQAKDQVTIFDLIEEKEKPSIESLIENKRKEIARALAKEKDLRKNGFGTQDSAVLEIFFSVIPRLEKEIGELEKELEKRNEKNLEKTEINLVEFHKMMVERYLGSSKEKDKEYLEFHLAKLKELEIEPVEPVVIEPVEPIEVETPEPIKIDPPKVRINRYGKAVLKSKVIPKTKNDKLPDQIKDYKGWQEKRALRFGASDFSTFTKYQKDIPLHVYNSIHKKPKKFEESKIEAMALGHFIESRTHDKLSESLKEKGKATLGEFEFQEVYLSKNRQYYNLKEDRLGAQVDAWGVLDGEKTIIEIKSTEQFSFERIKKALAFDLTKEEKQEILNEVAPDYYYQVQAQMFCTNSEQAVIHIVNRNRYETLTCFVGRDEKAIAWCLEIVDRFFKAKEFYVDSSLDRLQEQFNVNSLKFNLAFPSSKRLKGILEKIEEEEIEQVHYFLKQNEKVEVLVNELMAVVKQEKKLEAKLTRLGFKDEHRKIYKKSLTRVS